MATIKELQSKIATLEKGMKAKAVSPTAKAKAKLQIAKFKKEIADLKKSDTKKKSSTSKAKEIAKKYRKNYDTSRPFGGSSIEQDADRPAKRIGRRTSKDGNTYYEYRENRTDRKQPPKRYPRLEEGGMMAKGGELSLSDKIKLRELNRQIKEELDTIKEFEDDDDDTQRTYDRFGNPSPLTWNQQVLMEAEENLEKLQEQKKQLLEGKKMANGGEVDEELIRTSAKSIYEDKGMMSLRNIFLQVANTDEKNGDIETANLRRKIVKEYQDKQPKFMADGGAVTTIGGTQFVDTDLSGIFEHGGELHRTQEEMYARGGMIEHGLKVGDKIIQHGGNIIVVENEGKNFVVNLNKGKRWTDTEWFSLKNSEAKKYEKM